MDLSDGFRIGDWTVLPREGRIVRDLASGEPGDSRRVRRKAMDVLCALAARSGQAVERDELLTAVWGASAVTDEPLTSTIGELRRLLGDRQGAERRYIETIPKRGYRLLVDAAPLPASGERALTVVSTAPRADADGASTAQAAAEPREPGAARLIPTIRFDWKNLVAAAVVLGVVVLGYRQLQGPEPAPPPARSIAVLPFDDLSPAGDQGWFADGLADELMALLTRLPALKVAARNSAFSFRGEELDAAEVGARLKVAHVLAGSVRRMGNQVRVTAQLMNARDGYQMWSETFEGSLDDIFAIQDEIAGEVTSQLSVRLLGSAPRVRETDPRAYTLYLQARHVARQHTEAGFEQATEMYRQALAIDDRYLPAWNELAGVYFNRVGFAQLSPEDGYGLAREAALRALAIDPDYAPAHDRLGWLAMHEDNDLDAAAEHYRRALALEPQNDVIRSNAAVLAVALGRLDIAIELLEASAQADPVAATSHANLSNAYLLARRYRDSERSIRKALTLSPRYAAGHYRLGRVLLALGDREGARRAFEAEPLDAGRLLGRAMLANAEGRHEASDAALAELQKAWGDRAAANYAQVYAHRGDVEAAFRWLDVEQRVNGPGSFLAYRLDPAYDALRDDPRWPALMQHLGLDEARLAAVAVPPLP